jgi:hypothetical protein
MKNGIAAEIINLPCSTSEKENRPIDGFDLIAILGLMKEYNRQEIWKRYGPTGHPGRSISLYVGADDYFLEMHVQQMQRIILSEKFNTNPFFMQQVVQRITASHNHDLIMEKIRQQGIDTGYNPIYLSCSMGNTIIDLIVNFEASFPKTQDVPLGRTRIERTENRPLDVYDLSSTLYLCQQNLTETIFRRYQDQDQDQDPEANTNQLQSEVNIVTRVGDYSVNLNFHCVSTEGEQLIPSPGNASVATIHQVLQRMNFRHAPELILDELHSVGLAVTAGQLDSQFKLQRYINNTVLEFKFSRISA